MDNFFSTLGLGLDIDTTAATSCLSLMLILAFSTFASEDLACVTAGLLASTDKLHIGWGILACTLGIWIGDILLYLIGRGLRKGLLQRSWIQGWLPTDKVAAGEQLILQHGTRFLILSRFLPGTRLPGYLAAGALRYPLMKFILIMGIASAVWTPILCLASLAFGHSALSWFSGSWLWLAVLITWLGIALASNILLKLFSWRGRRLLLSQWNRLTRWEYWPAWVFYAPVTLWALWLTLRHRSLTVVALCNPGIHLGGFAMESKSAILTALGYNNPHSDLIATWTLIPMGSVESRLTHLKEFMTNQGLLYPIVVKPDVGERGQGVAIIGDEQAAANYLSACDQLVLAQRYVPGLEFGVFYSRKVGSKQGSIISMAQKQPLSLYGDGIHSLEHLVLDHPRARPLAGYFAKKFSNQYTKVPAAGEEIKLTELGNHCRGATFTDARKHLTPALVATLNDLTLPFQGFHYGRYDLRVPTFEDLQKGTRIQVLELNGLTAEPAHIYHPGYSLFRAWYDVCRGWSAAYLAGATMRSAGLTPPTLRQAWDALRQHRRHNWFEADTLLSSTSSPSSFTQNP